MCLKYRRISPRDQDYYFKTEVNMCEKAEIRMALRIFILLLLATCLTNPQSPHEKRHLKMQGI